MEKQITNFRDWWEIDTISEGIMYFDCEVFTAEQVAAMVPGASRPNVSLRCGHGARLSMPGYLDCTEWCVFTLPEDAEAYLDDLAGES